MKRGVGPVVLFDGVCKFCNDSVNFLIDRDSKERLRFAALQSATGQALLHKFGLSPSRIDTLVLVEGERCSVRSTAALRVTAYLDGWWWLCGMALFVPAFLRDHAYNVLASNRHRWFGTLQSCRVPTPELRRRFLD
jgi:predicted DCC family thiol-disulfide oxidoreductase YuxK